MTIKTSTYREKQITPGPNRSNCNSLYGVFEIGIYCINSIPAFGFRFLTPPTPVAVIKTRCLKSNLSQLTSAVPSQHRFYAFRSPMVTDWRRLSSGKCGGGGRLVKLTSCLWHIQVGVIQSLWINVESLLSPEAQ